MSTARGAVGTPRWRTVVARVRASVRRRVVRRDGAVRCHVTAVAVLDGRTLTGEAVIESVTQLAGQRPVTLRFRRRDATASVELDQISHDGSGIRAPVVVALEGRGVDLGPGLWRLEVLVRMADGRERGVPVTGEWVEPDDGPTVWNPRSPETGRRYRPVQHRGSVALEVSPPDAHAEVDRLTVADDAVTVRGRVFGAEGATAAAELHLTGSRSEGPALTLSLPAAVDGHLFSAVIPVTDVISDVPTTWRVSLRSRDGEALAVGRFLTDVRDPRDVFTYPSVDVGDGITVRPAYDRSGALLVRCRVRADERAGA